MSRLYRVRSSLRSGFIQGHPFVDGNKRIGHAAMEVFLVLNGLEIHVSTEEQATILAVFVAQRSGSLVAVGVASAHAIPLFHIPGQLVRLTALAVSRASQASGVGRALVAAVEGWAWSTGAQRVEVTSGDHRPDAHSFYQSVGYASDERRFIKHAPPVAANGS